MIHLYYHGGSGNHGCEALVRGTAKVLGQRCCLLSKAPEEDRKYGLEQVVDIVHDREEFPKRYSLAWLRGALDHKCNGGDYQFVRNAHRALRNVVAPGDICLSIGGDNYCYGPEGNQILAYYNRMLREQGAKTVLWGCSIEPSALTDGVIEDLKGYSLITARETITFEALKNAGLTQVQLVPDVAFLLDTVPTPLPGKLREGQTVGINLSPLAAEAGNGVFENYVELVRYLLEQTDMDVLLLPHVVKPDSDDRVTLQRLLEAFPASERIAMARDCGCMELKGMIARCRFFVGARTHATIAAYSSGVPTLVCGYSVKARGIARDLFGTDGGYVLPVQSMARSGDLTEAFRWLQDREAQIRAHLRQQLPQYCARALAGARWVGEL